MDSSLTGHSSFGRFRLSPNCRRAAPTLVALLALTSSRQAFCSEIHDAARDGDLAKIQALLKGNPGVVFSKDDDGETPLHYAAGFGHKDVAEALLAHRAVVDAKDNAGWTPLHFAAQQGHQDLAELLLAHNADVNARNNDGDTPLHMAGGQGYKKLAELLLAHKAAVDAQDKEGWTPMQIAVGNGHNDVVELLRQHGGHDSRPSGEVAKTIDTTIREATHPGNLAVLQALVKDMPYMVLTKDSDGRTPLHLAAGSGYKDVAEFWLAHKAEVDAKDNNGQTPLHLAVLGDHMDVVDLLLAKGADVNAVANNGSTPLHLAAYRGFSGYIDVAELLLAHKAEVNAKTKGGWTPLHSAAFNGNKEMAELLLADGADVNAKTDTGETPLYETAKVGSKDLAKLLIAHKADIDAADNDGTTPSRLAIANGHQDVADLLLARGADTKAKEGPSSTPSSTELGPTTMSQTEIYLLFESKDKSVGKPRHTMVLRQSFVNSLLKGKGVENLPFDTKALMLAVGLYAKNVLKLTDVESEKYLHAVASTATVRRSDKLSSVAPTAAPDVSQYGWEVPVVVVTWVSDRSTGSPESESNPPSDARLKQINEQLASGQYRAAIASITEELGIGGPAAVLYEDRGAAYLSVGEYGKGVEDLDRAIALDPAFPAAYNNRAYAYSLMGELVRALADYNRALELSPSGSSKFDPVNSYVGRGTVQYELHNIDAACKDWESACQLGKCANYRKAQRDGVCQSSAVQPRSGRRGVAQPVKWVAAGGTAVAITGNIELTPDKITIRNKDYPLTLVREIDARHMKDVAKIMSDQPIAARLYRTKIPKDEKFNSFGNSACDGADANWVLVDNAKDPYTGKPELGLAFFSGEIEPDLDDKVVNTKAGLLCGTFGYSQ